MAGELARVRTVLFDFDDTLVNTYPGRIAAVGRSFAEAGVVSPTAEEFGNRFNGLMFNGPFADIELAHGRELGLLMRYRRAYAVHEASNAPAFPGVEEVLGALRASGRRLGVVTSKPKVFEVEGAQSDALHQLEAGGLAGHFDHMVGGEDVAEHKPHPEAVLAALAHLGAAPIDTLMVGDSTADMGAARAAGCWSCYAAWGGRPMGPALDDAEPHYVANQPADVLRLLGVEAPHA